MKPQVRQIIPILPLCLIHCCFEVDKQCPIQYVDVAPVSNRQSSWFQRRTEQKLFDIPTYFKVFAMSSPPNQF